MRSRVMYPTQGLPKALLVDNKGLILNRRRMKQSTKIVTLSAARSGSPRLQSEGHFLDQNQSEKKPIVAPISRAVDNFRKKYQADMESVDAEAVNKQIRELAKNMRVMAMVLPFAATSGVHALILITKAVSSFINVYLLLLFVRVLLSWFPNFKWDKNPWMVLRQVTDPYLNLFRGMVPPLLGTIDFTPLLGFFILQWLSGTLTISDEEAYW